MMKAAVAIALTGPARVDKARAGGSLQGRAPSRPGALAWPRLQTPPFLHPTPPPQRGGSRGGRWRSLGGARVAPPLLPFVPCFRLCDTP